MKKILVTGAAGFMGAALCRRTLDEGLDVFGLGCLTDFYDPSLKESRLVLCSDPRFRFERIDICDADRLEAFVAASLPEVVVHLAAQPGVRYSLEHPSVGVQANVVGFLNVPEACRRTSTRKLVFASSGSVYGEGLEGASSVTQRTDDPVSLYGATKKASELMARTDAHLYGLGALGLRFLTVYGPGGRPDMAYFGFTRASLAGQPIRLFNGGRMKRDFTFGDDVTDGTFRAARLCAASEPGFRLYNLGSNRPAELERFVQVLEEVLGRQAHREYLSHQPGDGHEAYAEIEDGRRNLGFEPRVAIEEGLAQCVAWYRDYYGMKAV